MELKIKHIILAVVSLIMLGSTFVLPMRIEKVDEAKKISFGYPWQFASQDFSDAYSEKSIYPWYQNFDLKRPVSEFSFGNFVGSFAFFFVGLEILIFALEWIKWKISVYWNK